MKVLRKWRWNCLQCEVCFWGFNSVNDPPRVGWASGCHSLSSEPLGLRRGEPRARLNTHFVLRTQWTFSPTQGRRRRPQLGPREIWQGFRFGCLSYWEQTLGAGLQGSGDSWVRFPQLLAANSPAPSVKRGNNTYLAYLPGWEEIKWANEKNQKPNSIFRSCMEHL